MMTPPQGWRCNQSTVAHAYFSWLEFSQRLSECRYGRKHGEAHIGGYAVDFVGKTKNGKRIVREFHGCKYSYS